MRRMKVANKLFEAIVTDLIVINFDTQLFKEIYLVTSGGVSGEYLQAVYSYLGTIISTSVGILSVDLLIRSTHRFDELLSMST